MKPIAVLLAAAFTAALAAPASAEVRVTFVDGRVTIVATDATIPEILAEWARVGGSTFVDADEIPARERLTIQLENRLELDALDVLLRSVAGYMVAPIDPDPSAASRIAHVFILPTSTPGPYTPPPPVQFESVAYTEAPATLSSRPPQPDGDTAAPAAAEPQPADVVPAPGQPLGQASPLTNPSSTQTVPGLGVVTSSRPGVVIDNQPRSRRPVATPTRPRPGGGGGGR